MIKESSQDVLRELRATLGVLRQVDVGGKPGVERVAVLVQRADTLALRIADDGDSASTRPGPGIGLIGMRERAVMAGGTLEAGPRPGGGFLIEGVLPVPGEGRA